MVQFQSGNGISFWLAAPGGASFLFEWINRIWRDTHHANSDCGDCARNSAHLDHSMSRHCNATLKSLHNSLSRQMKFRRSPAVAILLACAFSFVFDLGNTPPGHPVRAQIHISKLAITPSLTIFHSSPSDPMARVITRTE